MKRFVIAATAAAALLASTLGAAAEDADYRVGPFREQVMPDSPGSSGPVAQAAVPSPYSASDPSGETFNDKADILDYTVTHGRKIKLELELAAALNPLGDAHWTQGYSYFDWEISTDGDEVSDYFALLFWYAHNMVAIVDKATKPSPPAICLAKYTRSGRSYELKFPRECIHKPKTIRAAAISYRDNRPYRSLGDEDEFDFAPDPIAPESLTYTPKVEYAP